MKRWRWLSFKRPRGIGNWPISGAILGATLVVALLLFGLVSFIDRPAQWPSNKTPVDQWTALGTLYAGGGFLLAAFAAVLATIAYVNSTEKPRLLLRSSMAMQFQDWFLSLEIQNRGRVAARFVAVRVRFRGSRIVLPYPGFAIDPSWRTGPAGWDGSIAAYWEGGADVVIHPKWDHLIPLLRCNIERLGSEQPEVDVEIVADDVPSFITRLALHDRALRKPSDVSDEDLVVRTRGSEFVTELAFTTFARPGVRQILSPNEKRRPTRLEVIRPQKVNISSSSLPMTISGTHGVLFVTSIVPGGFTINEEGSAGEEVVVIAYFSEGLRNTRS